MSFYGYTGIPEDHSDVARAAEGLGQAVGAVAGQLSAYGAEKKRAAAFNQEIDEMRRHAYAKLEPLLGKDAAEKKAEQYFVHVRKGESVEQAAKRIERAGGMFNDVFGKAQSDRHVKNYGDMLDNDYYETSRTSGREERVSGVESSEAGLGGNRLMMPDAAQGLIAGQSAGSPLLEKYSTPDEIRRRYLPQGGAAEAAGDVSQAAVDDERKRLNSEYKTFAIDDAEYVRNAADAALATLGDHDIDDDTRKQAAELYTQSSKNASETLGRLNAGQQQESAPSPVSVGRESSPSPRPEPQSADRVDMSRVIGGYPDRNKNTGKLALNTVYDAEPENAKEERARKPLEDRYRAVTTRYGKGDISKDQYDIEIKLLESEGLRLTEAEKAAALKAAKDLEFQRQKELDDHKSKNRIDVKKATPPRGSRAAKPESDEKLFEAVQKNENKINSVITDIGKYISPIYTNGQSSFTKFNMEKEFYDDPAKEREAIEKVKSLQTKLKNLMPAYEHALGRYNGRSLYARKNPYSGIDKANYQGYLDLDVESLRKSSNSGPSSRLPRTSVVPTPPGSGFRVKKK